MSNSRRKKQIVEDRKHPIPKEKPHHRNDVSADDDLGQDDSDFGGDDRGSGDDRHGGGGLTVSFDVPFPKGGRQGGDER